jgi:MFS family permease
MPVLPRAVWIVELSSFVTYFGTGLVLPFQVIYLHSVRGFSIEIAAAIAGTAPLVAIGGAFVGGAVVDRVGPRVAAIGCLLLGAATTVAFAFVTAPWQGFACGAVAGIALGSYSPTRAAVLAALAPAEQRHSAYAVQMALGNLGVAVGAGTAGLVAHASRPGTYMALFLGNAVCTAAFAVLLGVATRSLAGDAWAPVGAEHARPGYRAMLRQRAVIGFAGVTALFGLGGLAVFEVALPVFARDHAGLDERSIGLVFLTNSLVIVVAQLPIARLLEGRRRMPSVAFATGLVAVAWLIVATVPSDTSHGAAIGAFVAVAVLYAVAECVVAPIQGSLIADLAPPGLRGRCLALQSSSYAVGMTVGPVAIGFLLGRAPGALWPLAVAVMVLAGAAALALERIVPVAFRRVPSEHTVAPSRELEPALSAG